MTLFEFLDNFYGGTKVRILHHHDNLSGMIISEFYKKVFW